MARTKSSRGKEPFKMRSPETPYPFLGGVGKALGKVGKALTGGIGRKIMGQQSGAEMKEKDSQQKLDEIHEALVGGNEMGGGVSGDQTMAENTALTKKTSPMYHKPHVDADGNLVKLSTKTKDSKGVNHYHTEEYTQDYQDRPDKEEKK